VLPSWCDQHQLRSLVFVAAESHAPGASATAVAVRHGLHRNQIFAWRRQLRNHTMHAVVTAFDILLLTSLATALVPFVAPAWARFHRH
jgi:transposase